MSFQDFGKSKRVGTTTATSHSPAPSSGSYSLGGGGFGGAGGASAGGSAGGGLSQISESLLQYQRNVGILENIFQQVGQLSKKNPTPALKELQMQYHVQVDVVQQLEQKVQRQMQQNNQAGSPQLIKLSRDFETVRTRVQVLTQKAQENKSLFQYSSSSSQQQQLDNNNMGQEQQEQQQRLQLQLQEDRLAEEIMREREEEIRNINRGMHTVNEIYKDLAHIVGNQQEQIDQIETQMEDARANADSGLKQVEKANEKYGSSNCVIS